MLGCSVGDVVPALLLPVHPSGFLHSFCTRRDYAADARHLSEITNTQISTACVATVLLSAKPVNTMHLSSMTWYPPGMNNIGAANVTERSTPLSLHCSPPQALGCPNSSTHLHCQDESTEVTLEENKGASWRGHITRQEAFRQLSRARRHPLALHLFM